MSSTPSLSRISLVGHSLGGLYLRYAAKLLYNDDGDDALAAPAGGPTVAGLRPSVFMTIATPHLGVRRFTYVPLPSMLHPLGEAVVGGKTGSDLFLSKRSVTVGSTGSCARNSNGAAGLPSSSPSPSLSPSLSPSPSPSPSFSSSSSWSSSLPPSDTDDGRAGQHAPGAGSGGGGGGGGERRGERRSRTRIGREPPLLYVMATSEEFLRPLKAFRWRRVYANRRGDTLVPYGTAAFPAPDDDEGGSEDNGGDSSRPGSGGGGTREGGSSVPTGAEAGMGSAASSAPAASAAKTAKKIVGVSWVPPIAAAPAEESRASGGKGASVEMSRRKRISTKVRDALTRPAASAKRKLEKRKRMEREMAAGLNSCGWEKVSDSLLPGHLRGTPSGRMCFAQARGGGAERMFL